MGYTAIVIVLYIGTVARLTRLIVGDKITEPVRDRIVHRFGETSPLTFVFFCAWCMGMWIAFALSPVVFLLTELTWWLLPLVALTASQVTGLLHVAED